MQWVARRSEWHGAVNDSWQTWSTVPSVIPTDTATPNPSVAPTRSLRPVRRVPFVTAVSALVLLGAHAAGVKDEWKLAGASEGWERIVGSVSSLLVHADGNHLLTNVLTIVVLGGLAEVLIGRWLLPSLIVCVAAVGFFANTDPVAYLGSSGVAYALAGACVVITPHRVLHGGDREMRLGIPLLASALILAAGGLLDAVMRATAPESGVETDHGGHLRGFLVGAFVGVAFVLLSRNAGQAPAGGTRRRLSLDKPQ